MHWTLQSISHAPCHCVPLKASQTGRCFAPNSRADWTHGHDVGVCLTTGAGSLCAQVLGPLEKGLRSAAELGAWQLISPVDALGRVLVVDGLHEIQDEVCDCSCNDVACSLKHACAGAQLYQLAASAFAPF